MNYVKYKFFCSINHMFQCTHHFIVITAQTRALRSGYLQWSPKEDHIYLLKLTVQNKLSVNELHKIFVCDGKI
jgi:hypothetical protein